ncbi:MAG: hypothetical protein ACKO7W_05410 [Elainella sp.]
MRRSVVQSLLGFLLPLTLTAGLPLAAVAGLPPATQGLNLETSRADGVFLKVTGISVAEAHIDLTLEVTNGSGSWIGLNFITPNSTMMLIDNLGNNYRLVQPSDNDTMTVDSETTLKGVFVFAGELDPRATSLTLVTNSLGQPNNDSNYPTLRIENIPIPGRS